MASIAELKKQFAPFADMSDQEIAVHVSKAYGLPLTQVAADLGMQHDAKRNAFGAGLSAGVDNLQSMVYGAGAAGARAVGATGLATRAERGVRRNNAESEYNNRADLGQIEDQTPGSFPAFLANKLGEQVAPMGAMLAAGAALPAAMIPAAAARGAGLALPRVLGGAARGASAADVAAAGNIAARTVVAATPLAAGSMYGEAVEEGDLTQGAALKSLALAPVHGALEGLSARGMMPGKKAFAGGLAKRMGKASLESGATEAVAELGQNELEMSFRPSLTDDEKSSRRLNSAVVGGLVGGSVGSVGGLRRRPDAPALDPVDPIAETDMLALPAPGTVPMPMGSGGSTLEADIASQGTTDRVAKMYAERDAEEVRRTAAMGAVESAEAARADAAGTTTWKYGADLTLPVPKGFQGTTLADVRADRRTPDLETPPDIQQDNVQTAQAALMPPDPASNVRADPVQEELIPSAPSIQIPGSEPVGPAARQAVEVRNAAPGQGSLLDQRGNPTYQAEQGAEFKATPRVVAAIKQEFRIGGKSLKPNPKLDPLIAVAATAHANGTITDDQFHELMNDMSMSPSRFAAHQARVDRMMAPKAPDVSAPVASPPVAEKAGVQADPVASGSGSAGAAVHSAGPVGPKPVADAGVPVASDATNTPVGDGPADKVTALAPKTAAPTAKKTKSDEIKAEVKAKKAAPVASIAVERAGKKARQQEWDSLKSDYQDLLTSGRITEAEHDAAMAKLGTNEKGSADAETMHQLAKVAMAAKKRPAASIQTESTTPVAKAAPAANESMGPKEITAPAVPSSPAKAAVKKSETGAPPTTAAKVAAPAPKAEPVSHIAEDAPAAVADEVRSPNAEAPKRAVSPMGREPKSTDVAEAVSAIERLNTAKTVGDYRGALVYLMDLAHPTSVKVKPVTRTMAQAELDTVPKDADWKAAERQYAKVLASNAELSSSGGDRIAREKAAAAAKAAKEEKAEDRWLDKADKAADAVNELTSPNARMSVGGEIARGSNAEKVKASVSAWFRGARWLDRLVSVVQDATDLPAGAQTAIAGKSNVQGLVHKGRVYLVASNIVPGGEKSVLLHELGVHIGMRKLLGGARLDALAKQISTWAERNDGSRESELAHAAMLRVPADTAASVKAEEVVAYFVEEAINAGVEPKASTALGRWMQEVMRHVNATLAKLGLVDAKLDAQDLVDLAYGAAQLSGKATAPVGQVSKTEFRPGVPAFTGRQVQLTPTDIAVEGDEKLVSYAIEADGQRIGFVDLRVRNGKVFQLDNIKVFEEFEGGGHATDVLRTLLESATPGSILLIHDIQNGTNKDFKDVRPWWKARGVQQYNNSSTADIVIDGGVTLEDFRKTYEQARQNISGAATENVGPGVAESGSGSAVTGARPDTLLSEAAAGPSADQVAVPLGKGDFLSDLVKDKAVQIGREFMTLRQIADSLGKKFPALQTYAARAFQMGRTAGEVSLEYGRVQEAMASLPQGTQDALFDVMTDSTLASMHPEVPLSDLKNKHVANEPGAAETHAKLAAAWSRLGAGEKGAEGQKQYVAARDLFAKNFTRRLELLDKKMQQLLDPRELKGWEAERARWARKQQGPYFPLMRFGKWVTVWKSDAYRDEEAATGSSSALDKMKENPRHYYVSFDDSKTKSQRHADALKAKLGGTSYIQQHTEFESQAVGLNKGFLDKVESALISQLGTGDASSEVVKTLKEVYARSLPDYSAAKRTIQRRGVHGVKSADMMRALTRAGLGDAFYIARLENADEMATSLQNLKRQDSKMGQGATGFATLGGNGDGSVYNLMLKRHAASMKRVDTPVQGFLTNLTYLNMLGSSPAYVMINALQPWMITQPMLGSRHGWAAASAALLKGTMDGGRIFRTEFTNQGWRYELNFNPLAPGESEKLGIKPGERAMLKSLLDSGLIDITIEHDLATVAEGGNKTYNTIMRMSTAAPHYVETVNRVASALAAYRLELAKGRSDTEARAYAERVVAETQLDYSSINTPYRMMAGVTPMARLLFQFRKYQQGMIYLLAKNMSQAFKGDKEARNALFGMLATHGMMAGAAGLPVVFPLALLAKVIAQFWPDDDEPDPVAWWRNSVADMFGVDGGQMITKGLLSGLGVDVSSRLGLGNILNPAPQMDWGKSGATDTAKELLTGSLVPAVAGIMNYMKAIDAMGKGDMGKTLEAMLPKMFADPVKAFRLANEGLQTKAGNTVFTQDEISSMDVLARALGVQPLKLSEYYSAKSITEGAEQKMKDVRNQLISNYTHARRNNDTDAMNSVREDIEDFNTRHGGKGETVTSATLMNAFKNREKYEKQTGDGGIRVRPGQEWKRDMTRYLGD